MDSKKDNLLGILIEARIASRRKLAAAIMEGRVTVNGKVANNLRSPVNQKDKITIDGQAVGLKPKQYVYIMLNKPDGVLSTVRDERGRKTVSSFIPGKYRHLRLYPAGRLDMDTIGLLLLTNDGELTYRLTHPGFEHEKEYLALVKGTLRPEELKKLQKGVRLEDGMTAPAKVKEVKDSPPFNYSLTIHEGRKRQVRRMFEHLGYPVLALKRVRLGKLRLGDLKEGDVRELGGEELDLLKSN
ncbi:pseudouridine synthase [Chloroflexota bacterium]